MTSRVVSLIVRCIRVAPVVSCVFAGCTCSGGRENQAPAATPTAIVREPQAPTAAPLPTNTAEAAAPEAAPAEATPAAAPAAPESGGAAASDARRAECTRYVAALAGKGDAALLKDPELQTLAMRVPDLITCLAVKGDSMALCDPLTTMEDGQRRYTAEARDCIYAQSMYHEVRAYPKGTSFVYPEIEYKQCDSPEFCAALQEATRTGDETKCPPGPWQSICRAYVKLDPSLCRVEGKIQEYKDDKGKPIAFDEMCKQTIASRKFLAKGLQALADSGSPKERVLARAALGQADACAEYERAAVETCLALPGPGIEGTPPAGEAAPAAEPGATGGGSPAKTPA
jgi:hypothetical protein